jgi:hypothetical protein
LVRLLPSANCWAFTKKGAAARNRMSKIFIL